MEYIRTDDGQIQADLARRLGVVLKQYNDLVLTSEKFEVSLSLSIFQTLSTNCVELSNVLEKKYKIGNPFYQTPIPSEILGVSEDDIIENTFNIEKIHANYIIRKIRDSLSHPTKIDLTNKLSTTGYTTLLNNFGTIDKIIFISSPDITPKGDRKKYKQPIAQKFLDDGSFPKGVTIEQIDEHKFGFTKDDMPFFRMFKIILSPMQLLQMTYALTDYLSQPLLKNWDKKSFIINKSS
jgi:hypothetical protein